MNLTSEQLAIVNSTGDIRINAVAGSGKTTTLIEYARAKPRDCKILYLAFNKSVKLEAIKKFSSHGLHNVKVETAHSLAYKHIVFQHGYTVRAQGYKTHEIAEMLGLKSGGEKHSEYIIANHINKFITYFCNSDKAKVQDLNYRNTVSDSKARKFVDATYAYIENQTRKFLSKMDKGEIAVTHDFYLKKFQLSSPILPFDYILFDEGQDASAAMLDVFLKQPATKVIVGDTHQQIYGWRFAINSLAKTNFTSYNLPTSFRFNQAVADLANASLGVKKHIGREQPIMIIGNGRSQELKSRAVLGRSNLGLLLKAIDLLGKNKISKIYFEGNINSYTYADEGASLYDVLSLYEGKHYLVRDTLISAMKDMEELEDYVEKTEDNQLGMMVEIVKEYGHEIPKIIRSIKDKHVKDGEREDAEVIFSTVHRCKGLEYDDVYLVNDFISEEKITKMLLEKKDEEVNKEKLNEEINLLYVAVTRTKNKIHIPASLIPEDFPESPHIHVLEERFSKEEAKPGPIENARSQHAQKKNDFNEVRKTHAKAYSAWTTELDDQLTRMYCERIAMQTIASHFGRTTGAIRSRIKKLELESLYG
jgi:F-box protein, helicase, 18